MRSLAMPVRMPEASVDKYHFPPRSKHEVRLSWQILPVQPEAVTHAVNHAAYRQLRTHPLAADAAHVFTAVHGSQLRNDGLLVDLCGRQVAGSGKGKRDLVNGRRRLPAKFECADLAVRHSRANVVAH